MNINYNEGGVGRLERSRRIGSLIGLKMLVTLCVFCWHALPQTGLPDLGARRRELFFAISGFLVAYNRHGRFDGSIPGAARYALGKLRGIYPVYLVGLLLACV